MDVISLPPEEDSEKRRISLQQAEDKYWYYHQMGTAAQKLNLFHEKG